MLAARITSSSGVGFLFGSRARCMANGILASNFSVLFRSLLLRLRRLRILSGIDSSSPEDGVLAREPLPAEGTRSTELALEEHAGCDTLAMRQLWHNH